MLLFLVISFYVILFIQNIPVFILTIHFKSVQFYDIILSCNALLSDTECWILAHYQVNIYYYYYYYYYYNYESAGLQTSEVLIFCGAF